MSFHDATTLQFSRPYMDEREAAAAADVIRSGWIVGGPRLAELERRMAAYGGAAEGVGVSSWTTGAFLVLQAWGIGAGDEVIVPSLTFIASVNVARHVGARVVFADVDPLTWNIDPADVARKITTRTRAILPVDQIGLPCDIDAIVALARPRGIRVLQDAACSFGSRTRGRPIGALADATVFSLHARKVVTTGEGGMILTDDQALAMRLRRLRHQGMSLSDYQRHAAGPTQFESYPEVGYNCRMTDIQAAVGLVQLDKLDEILARRSGIAARYNRGLANCPLLRPPHIPEDVETNWQTYQVQLRPGARLSRNAVMEALHALGVPTRRGVMASHQEPPYLSPDVALPHTQTAAATTLQLPMHPALQQEQVDTVLAAIDVVAAAEAA
jgi:perosamine synthetase